MGQHVGTVAAALKPQNFTASADPAKTDYMIMLWYGTTRRTVEKPIAYELIGRQNVRILGFQRELSPRQRPELY